MRIYLKLSKNRQLVPFNYQLLLTGAIHKWLGPDNELHGRRSLFCFSWLQAVETTKKGINTRPGSYFFIGAHDELLIKRLVKGIMASPELCCGIHITELQLMKEPEFSEQQYFYTASPVFLKQRTDKGDQHIFYDDQQATALLTEGMKAKLEMAGLSAEGLRIAFDRDYAGAKTKLVSYKGIGNKASICPVEITGTPEQIAFAWNVGVGNSTGIGFGALK